jgi:hypothetical protein
LAFAGETLGTPRHGSDSSAERPSQCTMRTHCLRIHRFEFQLGRLPYLVYAINDDHVEVPEVASARKARLDRHNHVASSKAVICSFIRRLNMAAKEMRREVGTRLHTHFPVSSSSVCILPWWCLESLWRSEFHRIIVLFFMLLAPFQIYCQHPWTLLA